MSRSVSRARRIWARLLATLAVIIALPCVALTIARSIPLDDTPTTSDRWALVTAVSDFAVFGYALAFVVSVIALIVWFGPARMIITVLVLGLGAWHLSWIVPRYLGGERPPSSALRLRVLTQNLHHGQADTTQVFDHIQQADIVVLTELTRDARDRLRKAGLRERFPYEQGVFLTPLPAGGTRLFSRYPITSTQRFGGPMNLQIWLVGVQVPDLGLIQVLAIHPGSPRSDGDLWTAQQQAVLAAVLSTRPSMIIGDFNAVDSQAPLRQLRADGYHSSTELSGAGWQPTYPSNRSFPALVEIDHILLGPGLTATDSTTLLTAGTDHRAVLATVAPS